MDAIVDSYSDAEEDGGDDDKVQSKPSKRKHQSGPELLSAYGGKKLKHKMTEEYLDDLSSLQLMEARELRAWSHALDQRIVAVGRLLFPPASGGAPRSTFRDDELERVSRQSAELERAIIQYFRKTYPLDLPKTAPTNIET